MKVLSLRGLAAGYAGVAVVRGVDLEVSQGEIVALIGPNGAGKTTTLRTISGLLPALGGQVEIMGRSVDAANPHRIARQGVAHVAEDRALFPSLTVRQHLRLATGMRRRDRSAAYDHAVHLFPALGPLLDRRAGTLSGGEQQMVALARAIVTEPKLLLVDEMSLGLAPQIVAELQPVVRGVAEELGAAVIVVEQHLEIALKLAHRAVVLVNGRVALSGRADHLLEDPGSIQASYLG